MMEQKIKEKLKRIQDPELGINIVDLGLIYGVDIRGKRAIISLTMTTPLCPFGQLIEKDVKSELGSLGGIEDVEVKFIWEPPWSPERMSEAAKLQLGFKKNLGKND